MQKESSKDTATAVFFYLRCLDSISRLWNKRGTPLQDQLKSIQQNANKLSMDELKKNMNQYLNPLDLACQTRKPQIIEQALDCIQKLVTYGMIVHTSDIDLTVQMTCNCFDVNQEEIVNVQILKALLSCVTHTNVQGKSLYLAVKTCFNIYLISKDEVNQKISKATLTQMLDVIFARLSNKQEEQTDTTVLFSEDATETTTTTANTTTSIIHSNLFIASHLQQLYQSILQQFEQQHTHFSNTYQRDAFYIFRALSRLSMKKLPIPTPQQQYLDTNSLEMKSRILALQCIHSILERDSDTIIPILPFIKQHLCLTLLKNSTTNHTWLLQYSTCIFKLLVFHYRYYLKNEIGMLFSNVYLKLVNQPCVIQLFSTICENDQIVMDLFVNYDCIAQLTIMESMAQELFYLISNSTNSSVKQEAFQMMIQLVTSMIQFYQKRVKTIPIKSNNTNNNENDNTTTEDSELLIVEQKQYQLDLQKGIQLFNQHKQDKAIEFLLEHSLIQLETIAHFLLHTNGLSKQCIGEYLGSSQHATQLHDFVYMQQFQNESFEYSLRKFLNTLRLPGEGQQIDRIVQKFAEKYYMDNVHQESVFANADACYVFSYSIIMLNTDLHSPNYHRKRMTVQEFIANNRGLNDGKDFPLEFLTQMYDNVKREEIVLLEEQQQQQTQQQTATSSSTIMIDTIGITKQYLNSQPSQHQFIMANHVEYIPLLLEACFPSMLSSLQLLCTHDMSTISFLDHCIHLCSIFDMRNEMNTLLLAMPSTCPFQLECYFYIAQKHGNNLKQSWTHLLQVMIQHYQPYQQQIDKLFSNSVTLNDDAIVDFVKCTCQIATNNHLILQKLVEIAHYNMKRIKVVWNKIWQYMGDFLTMMGCNAEYSIQAIDALRQLSIKFLELDEMDHYHFQRDFLKPFLKIMQMSSNKQQRYLIIECMAYMIQWRGKHIKSGWKIVLQILNMASRLVDCYKLGYQCLVSICTDYIANSTTTTVTVTATATVATTTVEDATTEELIMIDLLPCILEYSKQSRLEKEQLQFLLDQIQQQALPYFQTVTHNKYWWPLLSGLSHLIHDESYKLRPQVCQVLFVNIFSQFTFDESFWNLICQGGILKPIFYDLMEQNDTTMLHMVWIDYLIPYFINHVQNEPLHLFIIQLLHDMCKLNYVPYAMDGCIKLMDHINVMESFIIPTFINNNNNSISSQHQIYFIQQLEQQGTTVNTKLLMECVWPMYVQNHVLEAGIYFIQHAYELIPNEWFTNSVTILQQFIQQQMPTHTVPLILVLLQMIQQLQQFRREFYSLCCQLILSESMEIRRELSQVLLHYQ